MRATYRVQLRPEFGFDEVAGIAGYLADLGISHVYCSPYLQARPGSTHGYDVVDPTALSEDLGGEPGHERMTKALSEAGLGHILDVVPNHMAINDPANPWWWDVLKYGPASTYASFFDIAWGGSAKILLPVLGDHYGRILEAGELRLDAPAGEPVVRYFEHRFPLEPESVPRDIDATNRDVEALHEVLEAQHYRLARWRVASDELNYRRFFAINDLAALRMENPPTFELTHRLVLRLVEEGRLQGVRIDHVDGLRRPADYLKSLRALMPDAYIVVEKILEASERLRPEWPVQGTTGYDFLNHVAGLFVDPDARHALSQLYVQFTSERVSLDEERHDKKLLLLTTELASDLDRLTSSLSEVCERRIRFRDYSMRELQEALAEVVAAFGVYRTYVNATANEVSDHDRQVVRSAVEKAAAARPDLEHELFELIERVLLLDFEGPVERGLAMRFQQLTGAVTAKGIEDTLFYTYNRLVSLNEVGGDPERFGVGLEEFHDLMVAAQRDWPATMLTTSTHDTKRSEDVRARISLLSEMPDRWAASVERWSQINERHRARGLPDRNTEYLLYQTLVGAWPLDAERAAGYMLKAAREAKVHTTWSDPQAEHEQAVEAFVRAVLQDTTFTHELEDLVSELREPWQVGSLAQTLIKLTAPGVPDIYQGCELWDLSLVDPDNRRAVDFDARAKLLDEIRGARPAEVLARAESGAPKLWVVAHVLQVRRERPDAFGTDSTYDPIYARGPASDHVVAFMRNDEVITIAPRLVLKLGGDWADTTLAIPSGRWSNLLADRGQEEGDVALADLLRDFPVALLVRS
ncbi:MAG: malto-oligosyltrehalose synthase [Actinomycetota bacterium]